VALPITTERLVIRPFTVADLAAMHAVRSDPEVMKPIPSQPYDREKSRAKLGEKISHQARHGFGRWAVADRASGTVIGECGLQYLDGGPEIELGYKLARRCWGRGLGVEAARACLEWALAERPEPVVAIVDRANTRSARVLARIGMVQAGTRYCFGHEWDFYVVARYQPTACSTSGRGTPGTRD
jgi:ribosomal-protein-alanine N-acetyltransferase